MIIKLLKHLTTIFAIKVTIENLSSVSTEPSLISEDPVEGAITTFNGHPSVKLINNDFNNTGGSFSFQYVSLYETTKEIDKLNSKKASLCIS